MVSHESQSLSIDADLGQLATVREFIERVLQGCGVQGGTLSEIRLAVDELVTNTILHGYGDEKGQIDVAIKYDPDKHNVIITLRDRAPLFDPFSDIPQYSIGDKLTQSQPGGFGLQLVQKSMDKLVHRTTEVGGNELTLIKQV